MAGYITALSAPRYERGAVSKKAANVCRFSCNAFEGHLLRAILMVRNRRDTDLFMLVFMILLFRLNQTLLGEVYVATMPFQLGLLKSVHKFFPPDFPLSPKLQALEYTFETVTALIDT